MLPMRQAGGPGLLVAAAMLALAAAAAGCSGSAAGGGSHPVSAGTPAATSPPAQTSAPASSPSPWPLVVVVPAAIAGQHQTSARPSAHDPQFQAEMTDLWAGIVSGRPALAIPAFFPVVAYQQVKAIADPAADWQNRLVAEYDADVIAAHHLIGDRARQAVLVQV